MTKRVEKLLLSLFLIGLAFLVFIGGIFVTYYRIQPSSWVIGAFEGAAAWYEAAREPEEEAQDFAGRPPKEERIGRASLIGDSETHWNKSLAYEGTTLITLRNDPSAYLLNMDGEIIHSWRFTLEKKSRREKIRNWAFINVAYAYPNGDLLVECLHSKISPYGLGLVKIDKDGEVIWSYLANAHHEVYVDRENGNIYLLTQDFIRKPIQGLEMMTYPLLNDYIVTLSPEGKELSKISVVEAFQHTPFEPYLYNANSKPLGDRFHTNSVMKLEPDIAAKFPQFKAGDLLISMREMDAVAVIDPITRKVKWMRLGPWQEQHAALFTDKGTIMLFDNLGYTPGAQYSRVIEFAPQTMEVVWQYGDRSAHRLYSSTNGRLQVLPNGNVLIGESTNARILEVTRDGKIAWEYTLSGPKMGWKTPNAIMTSIRYGKGELTFLKEKPAK